MILFVIVFLLTVLLAISSIFFLIKRQKYGKKPLISTSVAFLIAFMIVIPLGNQPVVDEMSDAETDEWYEENVGSESVEEVVTEPIEEEIIEEPVELTPQEKMIESITNLMDTKQAFDTGSYIKGEIPVGEYAFIPFSGSGQYYAEKDLAGNIIDNENFDSFGYVHVHDSGNLETNGVLISSKAFETLNVSSAKEIYEVLNDVENYNDSAWYKVGVDLPAGQYNIESYGEGYVAIMSGPVGNNEIVDNQIFNGKYTVNVKEGQFLKISKGAIIE